MGLGRRPLPNAQSIVVAALEEVDGEGVVEGEAADGFGDTGQLGGFADCRACCCVEAATFFLTARWVRKALTSGAPMSAG